MAIWCTSAVHDDSAASSDPRAPNTPAGRDGTEGEEMNPLGLALLVGGTALLVSGLVFLLPVRRKQLPQKETTQGSIDRIDYHLHETRRERGELS